MYRNCTNKLHISIHVLFIHRTWPKRNPHHNIMTLSSPNTRFVRDKHLLAIIPSLAFLDSINVDVFVERSMWETFRLFPSCPDGSGQSVLIQLHYFCTPLKASIGMYSRRLSLTNLVCDPAIPTSSFNFYTSIPVDRSKS